MEKRYLELRDAIDSFMYANKKEKEYWQAKIQEILDSSDEATIQLTMKKIQRQINTIGHRHCDTSHRPGLNNTTMISRYFERRELKKIYKLCEKSL